MGEFEMAAALPDQLLSSVQAKHRLELYVSTDWTRRPLHFLIIMNYKGGINSGNGLLVHP